MTLNQIGLMMILKKPSKSGISIAREKIGETTSIGVINQYTKFENLKNSFLQMQYLKIKILRTSGNMWKT